MDKKEARQRSEDIAGGFALWRNAADEQDNIGEQEAIKERCDDPDIGWNA